MGHEPRQMPPTAAGRVEVMDAMKQEAGGSAQAFDPEGVGYDYATARRAGMGPTGTGEDQGHWGSVAPASPEDLKRFGLPRESYVILKGKSHPTFDKAVAGEQSRGFVVKKFGNRYFSVPAK